MTLDDDFVKAVDRVSKELCTSRSAFVRKALREALARYKLEQPKHRHRRGGMNASRLPPISFRLGKASRLEAMNEARYSSLKRMACPRIALSIVTTFRLFQRRKSDRLITSLPSSKMIEVERAIRFALDI
jgi:Arc/MetJ-type ribon-helix-helix transcriptional regulator